MRIMPSCKETASLVSQSMDGKLPWLDRLGMRYHLLICRFCRRYEKQIRWIESRVKAVPAVGKEKLDPDFSRNLRRMLQQQDPDHPDRK